LFVYFTSLHTGISCHQLIVHRLQKFGHFKISRRAYDDFDENMDEDLTLNIVYANEGV
jgi:hypothetical protein